MAAQSSPYPVGGSTIASTTSPFANGSISGTLFSSVIAGDAANPYAGGLTFTYQLSLSPNSPDSSSEMTVSSFSFFQTDLTYNTVNPEVNPSNFTRSSGLGDVVRFIFLNQNILPGQTSALIVVQTDATVWHPTMAGIIDGLTVNVPSLAPTAVPEPATALLLAGFGALYLVRRQRRS